MPDRSANFEKDAAFLTLALREVEVHGDANSERDVLIQRLLTEIAELVRQGYDLNDVDSWSDRLSVESQQVLLAAFNSASADPERFAASVPLTEQLEARAETFAARRRRP